MELEDSQQLCLLRIFLGRRRSIGSNPILRRSQVTRKNLCFEVMQTYQEHKERSRRIQSAINAISALLPLDLYPAHKTELIGVCIWKITEADGKARVRYRSEGALSKSRAKLNHEHVHERRELISRLLAGEAIESVVNDAIACMVTEEEHALLRHSSSTGWQRYKDAGIRVFDLNCQQWLW